MGGMTNNGDTGKDQYGRIIPAGCKNAKLNLLDAWRTTYTHIVAGDVVRVQGIGEGDSITASPTNAPKRSMWVKVADVIRGPGQVQIVLAQDWGTLTSAAHASITRQERPEELAARLAANDQARLDSIAEHTPTAVEKSTARESRYVADHDTRMLLANRAMSIGYTGEGAARLMEEAYWVPAYPAPCGDECETHQGIRRYDNGDCEACEVERQAEDRLDVAIPPAAPRSEPQRRAIRLLGELEKSGAQPQINGGTLKTLVRDGWVIIDTRPVRSVITLTGDALAWLASEHTAEVTPHTWHGETVYGATCNCGPTQENPRLRRVPWTSAGLTSAEDAVAVALGHGAVSRPRLKMETPGEVLAAQEAALADPEWSTCSRCWGTLVWVHGMWIGVDGAEKCPNGLDSHKVMEESETSVTDARVTAEAPMPTSDDVAAMVGDPVAWFESLQPRDTHEDELARDLASTREAIASLTAEEVAGLPTAEMAAGAHNASRPWSAKGGRRKASSVAVKRRKQLAGAR